MNIYVVLLSISTFILLVAYLSALYKLGEMYNIFSNTLSKQSELRSIHQNFLELKNEEDIHKDNYINFLSDSRDAAFKYIDDIQSALLNFFKEIDPQIQYYNKYGIVVDGMIAPHDFALKKISKEIEDLRLFLPSENKR